MFLRGFVGEHVVPLLLRDVTGKLSPAIGDLCFFVESGRCCAACWSCYYGFEELFSMVTSACDVKAVTSSTR